VNSDSVDLSSWEPGRYFEGLLQLYFVVVVAVVKMANMRAAITLIVAQRG
jgi:hypothetical protein